MPDDAFRRRLESLNRGPLPTTQTTSATETKRLAKIAGPLRGPVPATRSSPALVGLLGRGETVATSAGEHLRIRLPLDELWPGGSRRAIERQEQLRQLADEAQHAVEPTLMMQDEFAALVAALPDRVLWLDLETCGLAGSALFLVGLLRTIDDQPTVELLLARDYAEEPAILETLWQTAASHEVLVTFNGKSFDWPMVVDRSVRYRLDAGRRSHPMLHLDMLHHARRRWRKQLPDCRLQTLEAAVCRRRRSGDIPGHRIPAAYAEFVRTGFERDIDAILYHNALDLVTLLDLTLRVAG
jgi:hypothetical protein